MQSTILRWLGMTVLLTAPGCGPNFGWPNLWHPGGFAYQRWKAEVFDPYPATDVGPMGSSPVGFRPPWYETPAPLGTRDYNSLHARFGPAPPQQSPVMP